MVRRPTPGFLLAFLFAVVAAAASAKVIHRAGHGFGDHIAYFRAAVRLFAGADPYAPTGDTYVYLYPPAWAVLVYPLTVCGAKAFGIVWTLILGASWLVARRAIRALAPELPAWALCASELFLARFFLGAWSSGQVTLPLTALCLSGLALAASGRAARGAALVGIAGSIKLYPLFLAVPLARLGGRRALTGLSAGVLAVSLLPAAIFGPARFAELVRHGFLTQALTNLDAQRWWSGRCAPLATAWHLAGGETGIALKLAEGVWALGLAALVWRTFPRERSGYAAWLGFAVLSMLMATPMLGENYLALLALPVAILAMRGRIAALATAFLLLNLHSPMFVGRAHCDALERLGLSAMGLAVLWVSLACEVDASFRARQLSSSTENLAGYNSLVLDS